jgi:hypothetical protein
LSRMRSPQFDSCKLHEFMTQSRPMLSARAANVRQTTLVNRAKIFH